MHAEILPELYLHGLAQGNFELALRGLLGAGAPLSATSIARLKAGWQAEYEDWKRRALDDVEAVYLWADGVYVKAGLEKEKAAILVVIAGLRDGRKVVLAVESGYRESTESLGDAAARSQAARLSAATAGDRRRPSRHLGRARRGLPTAAEQRCWNHRILNVLDKLPRRLQAEAKRLLTKLPYAETREAAARDKRAFQTWCTRHGVDAVGPRARSGLGAPAHVLRLPAHWKHLRTTNPVESPFRRSGCAQRPPNATRRSRMRRQ